MYIHVRSACSCSLSQHKPGNNQHPDNHDDYCRVEYLFYLNKHVHVHVHINVCLDSPVLWHMYMYMYTTPLTSASITVT